MTTIKCKLGIATRTSRPDKTLIRVFINYQGFFFFLDNDHMATVISTNCLKNG